MVDLKIENTVDPLADIIVTNKPPAVPIEQLYKFYQKSTGVSTDTRKIEPGNLFFALKGPSFNGNEYARKAIELGAAYAVVDEEPFYTDPEKYILVPNALEALQNLAAYHREQLNIPIIAIAGSNGKTTTKELLRAVLETSYSTFATPGNFNNEIGLPLALLMIKPKTKAAVIEMGARKRGDIAELCAIAKPTHGIITNTGKDHLETFLTLENTRKTNAELYEYLAEHNGVAFVNIAYKDLLEEAKDVKQLITYGGQGAQYQGHVSNLFPFLEVTYRSGDEEVTVGSQLIGKYNFENIMAAIAIAKELDVADRLIQKAIAAYTPSNNRSQLMRVGSNTFILDAYNANPSSMAEALDSLHQVEATHKVAILGDMLELGTASYEEHLLIALKLKQLKLDQIILVGPEFGKVREKLDCMHFDNIAEAQEWFAQQQYEDTLFLLKGSRGIAVEKILSK